MGRGWGKYGGLGWDGGGGGGGEYGDLGWDGGGGVWRLRVGRGKGVG